MQVFGITARAFYFRNDLMPRSPFLLDEGSTNGGNVTTPSTQMVVPYNRTVYCTTYGLPTCLSVFKHTNVTHSCRLDYRYVIHVCFCVCAAST